MGACADPVETGLTPTDDILIPQGAVMYVTDHDGNRTQSAVELRGTAQLPLTLNITEPLSAAVSATMSIDTEYINEYNTANGTDLTPLPAGVVTLSADKATITAGQTASAPVTVTLTSDGTLEPGRTYAFAVSTQSTDMTVAASSARRIITVRDLTSLPSPAKTWTDDQGVEHRGVMVFSCMEVNNVNPLNNLRYTLKSSGKPLIDAVILFSANINYNEQTGRVYIKCNDNLKAQLANYDKYIRPLKDAGIKVILSIVGNWDRSGIANLSDETARYFAREVKAMCDAYDLDGVFYDDEYSTYQTVTIPTGFVTPSSEAASRLIYEVWKLQPQRLNVVYGWVGTFLRRVVEVDGVEPSQFVNYVLMNYGDRTYPTASFPGITPEHVGVYSVEMAQENHGSQRMATFDNLRSMRTAGYGAMMVFALNPQAPNVYAQDAVMTVMTRAFYDDELIISSTIYPHDW